MTFQVTYRLVPLIGGPIEVTVLAVDLEDAQHKVNGVLGGPPKEVLGQPVRVELRSIVEVEGS